MGGRFLSFNDSTELPRNWAWFGVASKPLSKETPSLINTQVLRCWAGQGSTFRDGCWSHTISTDGEAPEQFWEWIDGQLDPTRPLWAYSSNLIYDLTFLHFWDHLQSGRYTLGPTKTPRGKWRPKGGRPFRGLMVCETRPAFVKCLGPGGVLWLVDAGNYFTGTLDDLAESVGVERTEYPDPWGPDRPFIDWLYPEVEVIRLSIQELVSGWSGCDCGNWKATAAQLAMTNFQHVCSNNRESIGGDRIVIHDDDRSHDLERRGYYGGRVVCYDSEPRRGRFYHLDVNSLYPSVMESLQAPVALIKHHSALDLLELRRLRLQRWLVASVRVRTDTDTYPYRGSAGVLWAQGDFWTVLAGEELLRAIDRGHVVDCGAVSVFATYPIFKEWVSEWRQIKENADRSTARGRSDRAVAKAILNSLYGKFAQLGIRWENRLERAPLHDWGMWIGDKSDGSGFTRWRGVAGIAEELVSGKKPRHYAPAISAAITAAARCRMDDLMTVAGIENIYYTATDSLITNEVGYQRLDSAGHLHPSKFGKLSVKGIHQEMWVRGLNWYELDDKVTHSGLRRDAIHKDDGELVFDDWPGARRLLSRDPEGKVVVTQRELRWSDVHYRGEIQPSGRILPPWIETIPEED